jgi:glycosyltransferase involved in cell wall biosynthesis
MPALRTTWHCDPPVVVAGADIPDRLKALDAPAVAWHADVDDLTPFYDNARVFVAPTRYSAGISLKVIEAAARGVPVVCTRLVADQLGWESGVDLLAADGADEFAGAIASLYRDADLWTRLRTTALTRVANEYSAIRFRSALQNSLRTSPEAEAGSGRSQRPLLRTAATAGD